MTSEEFKAAFVQAIFIAPLYEEPDHGIFAANPVFELPAYLEDRYCAI